MSAARALALLLVAAPLVAGCAAGRAFVGAPAPGSARPAHALLVRRCTACHATPEPAKMTAAEWQAGITLMKKRLHLPAAEWDSLAALQAETRAK